MSKPFRSFTCDGFAKVRCFSEGQRTEGHFLYPGASNAITIIVDLRSEHDLKVLLKVGHADSATNMQVIGLTHRPTGFTLLSWRAPGQPKSQEQSKIRNNSSRSWCTYCLRTSSTIGWTTRGR